MPVSQRQSIARSLEDQRHSKAELNDELQHSQTTQFLNKLYTYMSSGLAVCPLAMIYFAAICTVFGRSITFVFSTYLHNYWLNFSAFFSV